jgi:4-hydroxybenzoate polyprenyltransferase
MRHHPILRNHIDGEPGRTAEPIYELRRSRREALLFVFLLLLLGNNISFFLMIITSYALCVAC